MTRALAIAVVVSGFQLQYDPDLFARHEIRHLPRLTKQEIGTDIPIGLAPAREQIAFPDNRRPDDPDNITFFPLRDASVPNFSRAYPDLAGSPAAVRRVLANPTGNVARLLEAADLGCVDIAHAFHARVHKLKFAWGEGIAFLTQYTQEPDLANPATEKELVMVFLGITADKSHYVRAQFAVRHPSLPAPAKSLENLPASSFRPPLDAIEQMLASISRHRP